MMCFEEIYCVLQQFCSLVGFGIRQIKLLLSQKLKSVTVEMKERANLRKTACIRAVYNREISHKCLLLLGE